MDRISHLWFIVVSFSNDVGFANRFCMSFVFTFTQGTRSRVPKGAWQTGQFRLNVWHSFLLMSFMKVRHLSVVEGFGSCKIKAYLIKGQADTQRYEAKAASVFVY